jgi:PadR family transcriptional regulator PadR
MSTKDIQKAIIVMLRIRELYGYDLHKRLAQQEMRINISRLYGILNEMQKKGILESRWEKSSSGPRKKMYKLGEPGKEILRKILLEAISMVHLFYTDYLRSLLPDVNVFDDMIQWIIRGFTGKDTVMYLTYSFSGLHETLVRRIQSVNPQGKTYFVMPSITDLKIENIMTFEGTYDNLPFKDDFIDKLIIIGIPNRATLKESVNEWQRVLNENGKLSIITPSILIKTSQIPMTIGDFVEKYEHEEIEGGHRIDLESLFFALRERFNKVIETEMVHMSFISASNNGIQEEIYQGG